MRTGKTRNKICLIAAVLWMAVIFAFSARNADDSTGDSYYIGRVFAKLCIPAYETWDEDGQQEFIERIDHPVRKTAHAAEYAVLGCLLILAISPVSLKRRKEASDDDGAGKEPNKEPSEAQTLRKKLAKSILLAWGIATVYAATDEFHQTFVPGRAGRVSDVALDSAGAAIGILLTVGWVVLPYMALFIFVLIKNLGMQLYIGDDMIFRDMLKDMTWWEFSKDSYVRRNGRLLTDQLAALFIKLPPAVFWVLNSACFVLIAYTIRRLFLRRGMVSSVTSCLLVALFPFGILDHQGPMAICCNYVWPVTGLCLGLLMYKRILDGKSRGWEYALGILSVFCGADHEQIGTVSLYIFGALFLWNLIKEKKVHRYPLLAFAAALLSVVLVFTASGHRLRADDYSVFRIPNWPAYTFFDKVYMGTSTTLSFYTSWATKLYVVLAILVVIAVWKKDKRVLPRLISVIPVSVMCFAELLARVPALQKYVWLFRSSYPYSYGSTFYAKVDTENYDKWISYLPSFFMAALIAGLLISFLVIADTERERAMFLLVVSSGFMTRVAMGFSQTLFGSALRTHTAMLVSLMMLSALLIENIRRSKHQRDSFSGRWIAGILILMGLLAGACDLKLYLRNTRIKPVEVEEYALEDPAEPPVAEIETKEVADGMLEISGYAYLPGENTEYVNTQVLLKSRTTGEYYKAHTAYIKRTDVTAGAEDGNNHDNAGFYTRIKEKELLDNADDLEIWLLYYHKGEYILKRTGTGL